MSSIFEKMVFACDQYVAEARLNAYTKDYISDDLADWVNRCTLSGWTHAGNPPTSWWEDDITYTVSNIFPSDSNSNTPKSIALEFPHLASANNEATDPIEAYDRAMKVIG